MDTPHPSQQEQQRSLWWTALIHAICAVTASSVILLLGYVIWFFDFHPELQPYNGADAEPLLIQGSELQPVVVGGGGVMGGSAVITDFAGDEAILKTPAKFRAEDYPFAKVELEGLTRFTNAFLFWRLAEEPDQLYSLPLNRSGDGITQVAMVYGDSYTGLVEEFSIGFFDGPAKGFFNNNDIDIRVHSVELRPFSVARVIEQIWEDWTNPPLWSGRSNNTVRGIHDNGMVFPNLVLNLLVAISAVLLVLARYALPHRLRASMSVSRTVLLVIGLCWVMGDLLRWQWRIEQLIDTHERYAGLPLEQRIRNNPIRCGRFPEDCRADLLPYF